MSGRGDMSNMTNIDLSLASAQDVDKELGLASSEGDVVFCHFMDVCEVNVEHLRMNRKRTYFEVK